MTRAAILTRIKSLEHRQGAMQEQVVVVFGHGEPSGFVLIPAGQNRTFANQAELDAILAEVNGNGRADV